jgi:general secretion pathway protein E
MSLPMSSTRTAPLGNASTRPIGRLEWRRLLDWLCADGMVSAADADQVVKRYGAGDSSLPALVRLGGAGSTICASTR